VAIVNSEFTHDVSSTLDTSLIYHTLEVRLTSDDSVHYTTAIPTPPYVDIYKGGSHASNGHTTETHGLFSFNFQPPDENYYIALMRTFTNSSGSTESEKTSSLGGASSSTYSTTYPNAGVIGAG